MAGRSHWRVLGARYGTHTYSDRHVVGWRPLPRTWQSNRVVPAGIDAAMKLRDQYHITLDWIYRGRHDARRPRGLAKRLQEVGQTTEPDDLRSPIKHHLVLHKRDPEDGIARVYSL